MNAIVPERDVAARCLTYGKAILFGTPAVIAWTVTCVFILPRLRENYLNAGLDLPATGWLWTVPAVLLSLKEHMLIIGCVWIGILLALEVFARGWRRYRNVTLSIVVWAINVAVLFGLTNLLILGTMAGSK